MTRLAVDLAQLAALVDRMARFQAQLDRVRADVDSRVHALHRAWTGEAATAQATAHAQWRRGGAEVGEAIADLRAIAAEAHANYAAAVAANRRMWAQR